MCVCVCVWGGGGGGGYLFIYLFIFILLGGAGVVLFLGFLSIVRYKYTLTNITCRGKYLIVHEHVDKEPLISTLLISYCDTLENNRQ